MSGKRTALLSFFFQLLCSRKRDNLQWIFKELAQMHPSLPGLLKDLRTQGALDNFIDVVCCCLIFFID